MDKVICVVGPTASGKTALAVELAKRLDGEVISCDSMQIYRGLDVGTAKPTADETCGIPHHMIDVCDPDEDYSVSLYVEQATACAEDILSRGKTVIVAGGTGLYLDSFVRGLDFSTRENRDIIRMRLEGMYDRFGSMRMYRLLTRRDPAAADRIHPNDKKRLVRALEVAFMGGSKSQHDAETMERPPSFDALKIGVTCEDRDELRRRIDLRVDMMVAGGVLDEARELMKLPKSTAKQAIGYKELFPAVEDASKLGECVEQLKIHTHQYAKRQLTWFRRDKDIRWFFRDRRPWDEIVQEATECAREFLYNHS